MDSFEKARPATVRVLDAIVEHNNTS